MNNALRCCKFLWGGGRWGEERSDIGSTWANLPDNSASARVPFCAAETPPRFAPDAEVIGLGFSLSLHLDFQRERAWGETEHRIQVQVAGLRQIVLDAVHLEIHEVHLEGRKARYHYDGRRLSVSLAHPAARGERYRLRVHHAVERPAAGLYFTHPDTQHPQRWRSCWSQGQDEDSRYYFPCLDAPRFKQPWEARIFVPHGCSAISNGRLIAHDSHAAPGEDLWQYRLELPTSTYLFSVVAGHFSQHVEQADDVELRWFVQPGREAEGRNAFRGTAEALRFLASFTGMPYPYAHYTQVAVPDFIFGGMENFTATTQTDLVLHDDRAALDFSAEDLVVHEAAHTWFGNLVTARSWTHVWLHESFATYCETLYLGHAHGREEEEYRLLEDAEAYFHEDAQYRRALVTRRYEQPMDLFDAHLYPGGAVRLRHLHRLLGDEAFRGAVHRFLHAHRLGLADTAAWMRAVEEETGRTHAEWFRQWIYGAGYPQLEFSVSWSEDEGEGSGGTLEVCVSQQARLEEESSRHSFFQIALPLALRVGRRWERHMLRLREETTRWSLHLPARAQLVLLDPEYDCPAKRVQLKLPQDLLLQQLRHAPSVTARIAAAEALAEQPAHAVVQALGQALRREAFWGVQQRIARALGRIGGEFAREALLKGLRLAHPKARREVISVLGYFRDDARVGQALLRKARTGDASYFVEAESLRALGRCRAKGALPLLRRGLEQPSHLEVIRSAACEGLGLLGEAQQLDRLLDAAAEHAPALARPAAMYAAVQLARRDPALRPRVFEVLQQIAGQRGDPAGAFRPKRAAIRCLEALGMEARPLLLEFAGRERDARLVRFARLAAERIERTGETPQLVESLREDIARLGRDQIRMRSELEQLQRSE